MRSYSAIAIVLRRIPYGETDKILTLYGREQGRFSAIAKGARKPVSRLSGATEVLTCARFSIAAGKSLDVVTQAEVRESFPHLRSDLSRLTHGLYLADLLEHSTVDHIPNPLLFDLLTAGLYLVQKLPDPAIAARWFEMQVVGDLGYSPDLMICGVCHRSLDNPDDRQAGEEAGYALSASAGTALCPWHARPLTNSDHSALSRESLLYLRDLADLGAERGDELATTSIPAKAVLGQTRVALRRYLRYRLERDLKTWQFLDSIG